MKRLIIFTSFLIAPLSGLANEFQNDEALNTILSIFDMDPSTMGNIVNGTNAPGILGSMSHAVNGAALLAATALMIWTALTGAANTAHEGQVFGQRYNSMWIPIRTSVSIGMLVPFVQGYSLIQILILVFAALGFKTADETWQAAISHIENTGPIVNVSPPDTEEMAVSLFKSSVCMLRMNDLLLNGEKTQKITVNESNVILPNGNKEFSLSFDGLTGMGLGKGKCGEYKISHEDSSVGNSMHETTVSSIKTLSSRTNNVALMFLTNEESQENIAISLQTAVNEYNSSIRAGASQAIQVGDSEISEANRLFFTEAKEAGWIVAGSWFWTISSVNRRIADIVQTTPSFKLPNPINMPADWQIELDNELNRADVTVVPKMTSAGVAGAYDGGFGGFKDKFARFSHKGMSAVLNSTNELLNGKGEPEVQLQSFGHTMIAAAEILIVGSIVGQAVTNGSTEAVQGNLFAKLADYATLGGGKLEGLSAFLKTLVEWVTVILMFFSIPLLIAGLSLAFWFPAVPFINWLASITGWLIMLVESVVVAPFWAAAHAAAEGDGMAGQYAKPGYMLVLSLIARPVMMVMGLIAAMLVMHYATTFLLIAFEPFARGMHTHTVTGIVTILAMILLLVVLSLIIANKAYSLIYLLPDKALSYIGGGAPNLGESSMANESKALVLAGMSAGHGAASSAVNSIKSTAGGDEIAETGQTSSDGKESQISKDNRDLQSGKIDV